MKNTDPGSLHIDSVFDPQAQINQVEYKIVVALERISEAFRVLIWDVSKESGLSPIQIQILIFLLYHPENQRKVSYLAQEFNMTRPTISDAVRILFKKGLILKVTEQNDQRSYTIHLTDAGNAISQKAASFAQKISQSIVPLDQQEKRQMLNHLLKAIYHLQQAGVIHPQRMCHTCRFYQARDESSFYCKFLQQQLPMYKHRIDCPEHEFPV